MARRFFRAYGIEISDDKKDVDYALLSLSTIEMFIDSV